ncbi:MAG: copper resistance protein NlpE [Algoriphagus sp.]|jgi:uncharacterized lipoprotein NlpE involved in copper resistance|nr:copper resistance protein NlpE [Algoriphagus sp.]
MKRSLFFLLAIMAFQLGCSKPTADITAEAQVSHADTLKTTQNIPYADNSQTSLDWPGTYFNVLPCASCEGIETWLTLNPDGTFQLKTNYLGLNDAREEIFTGKFDWDSSGSTIQLQGLIGDTPGKYKVGENRIWHLDRDGNQIEGNLSDRYILLKKD